MSSLEYSKIKESLNSEDIIRIMDFLGAKEYQKNDIKQIIIFPTICHNINAKEARDGPLQNGRIAAGKQSPGGQSH